MASRKVDGDTVKSVGIGAGVLLAGYGVYRFVTPSQPSPTLPDDLVVPDIVDPPTYTRQAARVMAEGVYAALYGDGSCWGGHFDENEEAVLAILAGPRNDADVALVVDEYGRRSGCWWWSPTAYTLPQAVRQFLEPEQVTEINDGFAARGINWRF